MENIFKQPTTQSTSHTKTDFDIFTSATSPPQDQFDTFNITTEKQQQNDWLENQEQKTESEQFKIFDQPVFSRNICAQQQEEDDIEKYYIKNRKIKVSQQIQKFNQKMENGGINYEEESKRLYSNSNLNENRNLLNQTERAFKTLPKQFSVPYLCLQVLLLIYFFYVRSSQTYISSVFVFCAITKIVFSILHYCRSPIKHSKFLVLQGIIIIANNLAAVGCSMQQLGLAFLLIFIGADAVYLSKLKGLYEISAKIQQEYPSIQLIEDNQF